MLSTWMRVGFVLVAGDCRTWQSAVAAAAAQRGRRRTSRPRRPPMRLRGGRNWCTEHGVPEDICAQCNAKVAAEYQQKGDWCKEHNRPESQCFLCNPKLEAKFAAEYEAKYGKKPPKPEEKQSEEK